MKCLHLIFSSLRRLKQELELEDVVSVVVGLMMFECSEEHSLMQRRKHRMQKPVFKIYHLMAL